MNEPRLDEMTMRDLFALFAMQGLIGCSEWRESLDEESATCGLDINFSDFTAFSSYEMADAMLKARNQ